MHKKFFILILEFKHLDNQAIIFETKKEALDHFNFCLNLGMDGSRITLTSNTIYL